MHTVYQFDSGPTRCSPSRLLPSAVSFTIAIGLSPSGKRRSKEGVVLKPAHLKQIIDQHEATAKFGGEERPVYLRAGQHEDDIFVDLCNDRGEAVKLTKQGLTVVSHPACRFRRAPGMLSLPKPKAGSKAAEADALIFLTEFINLNDSDRILFLSLLLAAFRFEKPTPITIITGEHGSGKTMLARIFRALTSSRAPVQTASGNERDLQIACLNSWVVNIDNQSRLSDSMSDNLCRLATGSGLRTRALYTDNDEKIFNAVRLILLNSIKELATRPDFLDRTVHLHTLQIKNRKSLWHKFNLFVPRILGALMTAVSVALKNMPTVKADNLPRMADYAKWAMAGALALGFTPEEFLSAYRANPTKNVTLVLDESPIYLPLHASLDGTFDGKFTGSTKELLARLGFGSDLPRTPRALSSMLDRLIPNLRTEGIEIKHHRDPVRRVQILETTKTWSAEEIAAKTAAFKKQQEEISVVRAAREAERAAAAEQRRKTRAKECAEWLKRVLEKESGPMRTKRSMPWHHTLAKMINAAAKEIGVHEELRPEGKFWSLATGATTGA